MDAEKGVIELMSDSSSGAAKEEVPQRPDGQKSVIQIEEVEVGSEVQGDQLGSELDGLTGDIPEERYVESASSGICQGREGIALIILVSLCLLVIIRIGFYLAKPWFTM